MLYLPQVESKLVILLQLKQSLRTRTLFIYSVFLILTLLFCIAQFKALAISPSFPVQQIFDSEKDDWNLATIDNISEIGNYHRAENISECMTRTEDFDSEFPLPNIRGVSYDSDGKKLNVTFWLNSPLEQLPLIKPLTHLQASFGIGVHHSNVSLENYTSTIINRLKKTPVIRFIDNGTGTINHMNYTNVDYEVSGDRILKYGDAFFKKNSYVYRISYRAEPEIYEDYLNTIGKMVETFVIQGVTPKINNINGTAKVENFSLSNHSKNNIPAKINDTEFSKAESHVQELISYVNPDYVFAIQYPHDWKKEDSKDPEELVNFRAPLYRNYTLNVLDESYFFQLDPFTFHEGQTSDYMVELSWNNNTKMWTQILKQISPSGLDDRIIDKRKVDSNDIEYGKSHISLSFDLSSINFPERYGLIFGIQDKFLKGNLLCYLRDGTESYFVPSPEFNMTLMPNFLRLKPGQEKTIELGVTSNSPYDSVAYFQKMNNIQGLKITIDPNSTAIPTDSTVSSLINIKALDNAVVNPYTLAIRTEIYPNLSLVETSSGNQITGLNHSPLAIKHLSLPITVEEPLSVFDYFNNVLNTWGASVRTFFQIVAAVGGAGIFGWILNKTRKKGNQEKS